MRLRLSPMERWREVAAQSRRRTSHQPLPAASPLHLVDARVTALMAVAAALFGHQWRATVSSRAIKGTSCRRCFLERHTKQLAQRNRQRPPTVPIERALGVRRADLVAELHPTMNGELYPYAIGASSHRRLWWRCSAGHEWQTTVNTRSRGCGCPTCKRGQIR